MKCGQEGCGGMANSSGFCPPHQKQQQRQKVVVRCDGCNTTTEVHIRCLCPQCTKAAAKGETK